MCDRERGHALGTSEGGKAMERNEQDDAEKRNRAYQVQHVAATNLIRLYLSATDRQTPLEDIHCRMSKILLVSHHCNWSIGSLVHLMLRTTSTERGEIKQMLPGVSDWLVT